MTFFVRPGLCRKSLHLAIALLGAVHFPPAASVAAPSSESYKWRNVAMVAGGFVPGLEYHPEHADLLYARTDVGGTYRFDFGKRHWIPLNDDIGRSHWQWNGVTSVAFDRTVPNRVYQAVGSYPQIWGEPGALMRSENRGATWETFALPVKMMGNADGRNTGERLLVDPTHSDTLWLGTPNDGLWRSFDRGETWQPVSNLPVAAITFVFAAPLQGAKSPTLYVAAVPDNDHPAPLWRSTDQGETWQVVPGQPEGLIAHQFAWAADHELVLTYGNGYGPNGVTAGACWRYRPEDDVWTNFTPALTQGDEVADHGFAGLAAHPDDAQVLLVASLNRWSQGNQIWLTTDGGTTWSSRLDDATWDHQGVAYAERLSPHWITDIALDPIDGNRAWFVTGYGVWSTADINPAHGAAPHWEYLNAGLEETVADELISPPLGAPLLSALGDIGGFRHDTLDTSPTAGTFSPGHGTSTTIAFAGQALDQMVRTHSQGTRAARSRDGGKTWRLLEAAPIEAIGKAPGILTLNADASRLFWLPKGGGLYRSDDDGDSWTAANLDYVAPFNHRTARVLCDRVDPAIAYVQDPEQGQFFATTDGGDSWTLTQSFPPEPGKARAEPERAGTVWVPTANGLYVSEYSGQCFAKLPQVDAAYEIGFGRAAPGAERPTLFMQGRVDGVEGIYRSDDAARSWVRIDDPAKQYGHLRVVMGDGQVHGRVYLGTSGRGIIVGEPAQK